MKQGSVRGTNATEHAVFASGTATEHATNGNATEHASSGKDHALLDTCLKEDPEGKDAKIDTIANRLLAALMSERSTSPQAAVRPPATTTDVATCSDASHQPPVPNHKRNLTQLLYLDRPQPPLTDAQKLAQIMCPKNDLQITVSCWTRINMPEPVYYASKTFTLDELGADSINAGGAKAKKIRMEVLERLRHMKAGLSADQRNDWSWFKEFWDQEMVIRHGQAWAKTFSGKVQKVLDDERSNAFSVFVYNETRRVFQGMEALPVPGS